jgi:GT2 family glycosyltransferase
MTSEIDVTIVIANWNGELVLRDCLNSVYDKTQQVSFEIIVVDDCSTDNSIDLIRREFPDVRIIINKENLGYAKTNNQALSFVRGRYLLLLNNDTMFENNALSEFVKYMDTHLNIGICGGTLVNPDKSIQHSYGDFPSLFMEVSALFSLPKFFPKWRHLSLGIIPTDFSKPIEVDMVVGANLFIRSDIAKALNLYDEAFKAYFEDSDLCYRVRQTGFKVVYLPFSYILHIQGHSYGNEFEDKVSEQRTKNKIQFLMNGYKRFCRKHYKLGFLCIGFRILVSFRYYLQYLLMSFFKRPTLYAAQSRIHRMMLSALLFYSH